MIDDRRVRAERAGYYYHAKRPGREDVEILMRNAAPLYQSWGM
jgi:hypothetical protein